jgi:putative FmdB family regulatory protein
MPTYQYRCPNCGNEFEEFQSITDAAISKCPKCEGKPHRIITGGAGFLLKGTGFYATDYRSASYKADAKKDSAPVVSDSKSSDKSSAKKGSDKK